MVIVGDSSKGRLIAAFFDHLLALVLMMLVEAFIPESLHVLKIILFFLVYLAYFVVLEALWSRTVGKFFQGLVVRKLDGSRCDWKAAAIRTAARLLEVNPVLFGGMPAGVAIFSSPRKQRIGDVLAGTLVVSSKLRWTTDATGDVAV
jgi:uncharacterized RDD family membrane protein YckC